MTQAQAFELQLSKNSDSTVLRGKIFLPQTAVTAGTVTSLLLLSPNSTAFGARCVALGLIFSNYRIKYLKFKWMGISSGTASSFAMGVLDDASGAEGNAPTTINGILEQRCSSSAFSEESVPTEFEYKPVDTRLWYKTQPGSSGSDPRLSVNGVLYAASNAAGAVQLEVDYCFVFKGATDVSPL